MAPKSAIAMKKLITPNKKGQNRDDFTVPEEHSSFALFVPSILLCLRLYAVAMHSEIGNTMASKRGVSYLGVPQVAARKDITSKASDVQCKVGSTYTTIVSGAAGRKFP
jgi:hypothetical protein